MSSSFLWIFRRASFKSSPRDMSRFVLLWTNRSSILLCFLGSSRTRVFSVLRRYASQFTLSCRLFCSDSSLGYGVSYKKETGKSRFSGQFLSISGEGNFPEAVDRPFFLYTTSISLLELWRNTRGAWKSGAELKSFTKCSPLLQLNAIGLPAR